MESLEPEGWRELWERAQTERDSKKLLEILDDMNRLLNEWEKKNGSNIRSSTSDLRRGAPPG